MKINFTHDEIMFYIGNYWYSILNKEKILIVGMRAD
jgi:hypothetical protein